MTGVYLSVPRYFPLSHPSSCILVNHDPHSRAPKKNTSHRNEVLPQDTTHLIQRPCYQQGSLCQDPADNWTTRRPGHFKEMQTSVVRTCLPFIRSDQNHPARHSERGVRRQGRQRKMWEDNIGEWTGLDFAKFQRALYREKWRKLVVKSSVVPQQPFRLRYRWWWWQSLRLGLCGPSEVRVGWLCCSGIVLEPWEKQAHMQFTREGLPTQLPQFTVCCPLVWRVELAHASWSPLKKKKKKGCGMILLNLPPHNHHKSENETHTCTRLVLCGVWSFRVF